MPRVYTRKFDHDVCLALWNTGQYTKYQLARKFVVSWAAIDRVVNPRRLEIEKRAVLNYRAKGRCDDCGGPMNNHSRALGSTRCRPCSYLAQGTTAREGELQCGTCKEWKPDEEFPRNRHEKWVRRGRHGQCRVCTTIARREYRARNLEKSRAQDRAYKKRRRALGLA